MTDLNRSVLASQADLETIRVWNSTDVCYAQGDCSIPALIHGACERFSERIAVVSGETEISYAELADKVEHIATVLVECGVRKEERVAMMMHRSDRLPVVMIGIMQAGGAFVTLDPESPDSRIEFILKEADVSIVFADQEFAARFPESVRVIDPRACLEQTLKARPERVYPSPEDLAYVLYTSGSTGRPKGVMNEHKGISNRILWGIEYLGITPDERLLQKTPYTFDVSLGEFFMPLVSGASLIMAKPEGHRDTRYLVDTILEHAITYVHFVPSMLDLFLRDARSAECTGLKRVVCSGEALTAPLRNKFFERLPAVELQNLYGPTEAAIEVSYYQCRPGDRETSVPIGWPTANTQLHIVNEQLQAVALGEMGELLIGGVQVARGYIQREDLSAEKFIGDHLSGAKAGRLYRTGDLARFRDDGAIEYHGRIDDQIKVRGVRVESGEIESALETLADVNKAVVKIEQHDVRGAELCAYIEAKRQLTPAEFRAALKSLLPEALFPQQYFFVDGFELTSSGKVDRKKLQPPSHDGSAIDASDGGADTAWVRHLKAAWKTVLGLDYVGSEDQFFDLGGSSLLAHHLVEQVLQQTGIHMSVLDVFDKPILKDLAEKLSLSSEPGSRAPSEDMASNNAAENTTEHDIAIVGMAGRFPGARNLSEIWENLIKGRESTTQFSLDELDPSIPESVKTDPAYVKAAGLMPEAKCFDAAFFKVSAREAEVMDPQHRIFLELCWHAMQDAGMEPDSLSSEEREQIGVYAGSGVNTYFLTNVQPSRGNDGGIGEMPKQTATEKDYIATRVAYKLGLKGPAITVQTACSTSLVAIITACQSIRSGQLTSALAGGISVNTPQHSGRLYQEGGMYSPDGLTRTFDADAKGTAFNSGAGVVMLKSKAQALQDGDRIYAVIKGLGINNDGAEKASFTAPSIKGQQAAISMAMRDAAIDARTISYVEVHGTATPLGDPIEVEALKRAFADNTHSDEKHYCALGSVKTNVGHMVAAAGVGGLIKTALAMYHQRIPESLHFHQANPQLKLEDSPFVVANQARPWPLQKGEHRRAGVSSFGVGGTNAHVILEDFHVLESGSARQQSQPIFLSAKTPEGLLALERDIDACLSRLPLENTAEFARQLNRSRKHYAFRSAATLSVEAGQCHLERAAQQRESSERPTNVIWMFPGQGNQYPGMVFDLCDRFDCVRHAVDSCLNLLPTSLARPLRDQLLDCSPEHHDSLASALTNTQFTQLGLFITEYALAQLWLKAVGKPYAMIGHSIGEFVAATIAGVFSLKDALEIVSERGRLMQAQPAGSMLSVRAAYSTVKPLLPSKCDVAAINADELIVIAGPDDCIDDCQRVLEQHEIASTRLPTSHAFHSSMMDGVLAPFEKAFVGKTLSPPAITIVSSSSGQVLSADEAVSPKYWVQHLRQPVNFSDALDTALDMGSTLLLELGPRNSATTFAQKKINRRKASGAHTVSQCAESNSAFAVASMAKSPDHKAPNGVLGQNDVAFSRALGACWALGIDLNYTELDTLMGWDQASPSSVFGLPGYPFDRSEHWLQPLACPEPITESLAQTNCSSVLRDTMKSGQPLSQNLGLHIDGEDMKTKLLSELYELFSDASGTAFSSDDVSTSFFELGFDSLLLTQVSLELKRKYKLDIPFRRLMEDLENFELLSEYLLNEADASVLPNSAPDQAETSSRAIQMTHANALGATQNAALIQPLSAQPLNASQGDLQQLINAQLSIMQMQLQALSQGQVSLPVSDSSQPENTMASKPAASANGHQNEPQENTKKPQIRGTRIVKESIGIELSSAQRQWLERVMLAYQDKYAGSKKLAQQHRKYFADPRTVSGFNPEWKEIVFPIATERSKGSKLYCVDGNELIDLSNGFGPIMFGHSPDFVTEAVQTQLLKGIETGPQSPMAGEVVELFCQLTGNERGAFACTGSEAVMGAVRLARTVTGRKTVVMFEGAYHGIFDEVITRPGKDYHALPSAPGIMRESLSNMLVIPWADPEAFGLIESLGDDLAAILVEPVQSRMPEFHDREYIQRLRQIADSTGAALIIDEVVTGFRVAAGGVQERFDVKADLATYGKVIGGGHPIGMLGGKAKFMDALDGGYWSYGDDSVPEAGVTYFAGTFVRHPVALAAAKAVLGEIMRRGEGLYRELEEKTEELAAKAKAFIAELKSDVTLESFASLFYVSVPHHAHWGHLFFTLMQTEGIHIQQFRPNFLTTAHTKEDIDSILSAFKKSLAQMIEYGLLEGDVVAAKRFLNAKPEIPEGAKLGRNQAGEPAYFVEDPDQPGNYIEVGKP